MNHPRFRQIVVLAIIILAAGEFVLDLHTPRGVADWIGYFIPLLLSIYVGGRVFTLTIAAILTILMVVGVYLSPPGADPHVSIANRYLGVCMLWVMALLVFQRKRAEEEVRRANRALRTISNCNQTLVRATSETELLQDICRIIVEDGGYSFAWVGFAQDDEPKSVRPTAQAGRGGDYLKKTVVTWDDSLLGHGPTGTAIRKGEVTICRNILTDLKYAPWRDEAIQRGFASSISLPLLAGKKAFGALAIYSPKVDAFRDNDVKLLAELADDLAYGIQTLRTRADHQRMETQVVEQARLLELAHDAIIVLDLENHILYWNRGAEKIYGWTDREAVGQEAGKFLRIGVFQYDHARKTALEKDDWQGELTSHNKGGEEVLVETRWTLVRNNRGEPKSILAICTNITESKKLENQFYRAQRMESLGTLASGIAHDLNNVLTPLLVSAQLLKEKIPDPEIQKLLDNMETYVHRGARLIKQVLSFGRGVEGERLPVQPARIAREIEQIVHETFPKSVEFEFHSSANLWTIIGDATQLNQVLLNLCVNARDAMPEGGKLTISMRNVVLDEASIGLNPGTKTGPYICIDVTDTGMGIPREIQDKIFEPFFTTKPTGKGTGLGLSTSLGIVKSHDGFISCHSEEGKGSTFRIYLPAETKSIVVKTEGVRPTPEFPRGNGEWVLVVDDEETIRGVVQKTLERYGYKVIVASNGAEAVSIYATHQPPVDVVVTDMAMPIMDGSAAVVALKSINPDVKIIASSGLAFHENFSKVTEAGVRHFIPKPYTAETMLDKLHEVLHEKPH